MPMKKNDIKIIVDEFLLEMETSNKSRNTIVNYRSDLKSFVNNCQVSIENITVETLREHLEGLSRKSPTTKARNISSLKMFLNWCFKKDFIPVNPLLKIEHKNQKVSLVPKKMEKIEIDKVLCSIKIFKKNNSINANNLKYRLIFTLMLEAGLKVNEVLNLEYQNIEVDTQTIFVNSDCPRRIPLFSSESIKLFRLYTDELNIKSGLIFKGGDTQAKPLSYQALNKFWRKCCTKVNADIKLQQLRDCFAQDLVKRGINICIISQMLGHKNLQTTVKYLQ